jgi:predicted dithiol-disulfide oxidoreductase (DUF899 family)
MPEHQTATRKEWAQARAALLTREKEYSRLGDEIARQRRALPWVPVEKKYAFESTDGVKTLAQLFDGRSQLVVYHFMFGPGYEAGCLNCSATADSFNGVIAHLEARDVTMLCVSRAPLANLLAYRERMGWSFEWVSSGESDFNSDFGVAAIPGAAHRDEPMLTSNELAMLRRWEEDPQWREHPPAGVQYFADATGAGIDGFLSEGHGVSAFVREGDRVYHCYSSYARGTEFLMGYYAILDRVPRGRSEDDPTKFLMRRHDEYGSQTG